MKKLELLHKFQGALWDWERGHERNLERRSWINQNLRMVKEILSETRCNRSMTISPPPAVGGIIMRNVDPLDTIFNPPYFQSLIPQISDIIDQSIGVIEQGSLPENQPAPKSGVSPRKKDGKSVFVVHGHDNQSKLEVARKFAPTSLSWTR